MAKKKERTIEIPEGIATTIEGTIVKIKGEKGELQKEFCYPGVSLKQESNKITIAAETACKKHRSVVGTYESHLKNMFKGVTEGYTATMKAVYAHFPITIKQAENVIEVHNFLGEKVPRKGKIHGDAQVKIQKDDVTIEGINKEDVGQTAANIELATRIKNKDTRVFQDGVYITQKP
jgi:large subunit ribosomal protein L6